MTPAPIEPAPDAPIDFEVSADPVVGGNVLTGLPIGNAEEATDVSYLLQYAVPEAEGATVEVVNAEGETVPPTDPISTGQVVQVVDASGNVISSSVVVIQGDVLGTGRMSLTQLVRMVDAFNGKTPLEGAFLAAGKFTDGDRINLTDLVKEAALYRQMQTSAE